MRARAEQRWSKRDGGLAFGARLLRGESGRGAMGFMVGDGNGNGERDSGRWWVGIVVGGGIAVSEERQSHR